MTADTTHSRLAEELDAAIGELHEALQRATAAAGAIRALAPRLTAIDSVFSELEAVISHGREQIGSLHAAMPAPHGPANGLPAAYPRPTLVPTGPEPSNSRPEPSTPVAIRPESLPAPGPEEPALTGHTTGPRIDLRQIASAESQTCFRLEFESRPGPLDLRAVDDAVSEHPAVRDVALLDYDGRKATLKVWIVDTASPAQIQSALTERTAQIFNSGNSVTVVALEDVA